MTDYPFENLMRHNNLVDDFSFDDRDEDDDELPNNIHSLINFWQDGPNEPEDIFVGLTVRIVDEQGGNEGGGEHVMRIYEVTTNDSAEIYYFKKTGFYESYNGTEWDSDVVEVFPKEIMVVKYYELHQL